MRGHELREEVFVCGRYILTGWLQTKQGIVVEEGKVWAAPRHSLSVADRLKVWVIMIPLLKRKHGNQGSVWCMLQRERVLQGVRWSGQASPTYSVPHRAEKIKTIPECMLCFSLYFWYGVWIYFFERIEWMKIFGYIMWGIIIFDYIFIFFIPPLLLLSIFLVFWELFIPEICGKKLFPISLGWKQNCHSVGDGWRTLSGSDLF